MKGLITRLIYKLCCGDSFDSSTTADAITVFAEQRGDTSSDITNPLEMLQLIEQKWSSCIPTTLKQIAEECRSFLQVLDGYRFSEESCSLDTLRRIEEDWGSFLVFSDKYLSKLFVLKETLWQSEQECSFFHIFLSEQSDFLYTLQQKIHCVRYPLRRIGEECGSLVIFSEKYLSSKESLPIETLQRIKAKCDSLREDLSAFDEFKLVERSFKFLYRDFYLLDFILNLQIFTGEPHLIKKVQALFQGAAADLFLIYLKQVEQWGCCYNYYYRELTYKFEQTKLEIRRAEYSFFKVSFQLLANNDGTVVPNFILEFIDTVIENLSELLKLDDPSSPLHVGGLVDQVEKTLKELKFLRSFVCFVSDRCVEPQVQHTFFSHVLEVAWHTTMVTWLYLPSDEHRYRDLAADEGYPLFSDLLRSKIQPNEPSISKIYIDVLQAIKLEQSQWYPVIQIKYAVDCEVGFLETLLHILEELPISGDCIATKATLQEMLNLMRTNLKDLPTTALEFHLQDIDSVIVDAGILVYSLVDKEKYMEDSTVEEMNQLRIQRMKAMIYLTTRKRFLLQLSLPDIDELDSADFILDNLKKRLCHNPYSIAPVETQLQTIRKEIDCFLAVVKQHDELQPFATRVIGLANEVKYMFDACTEKDVPDWCLSLWILDIVEEINILMAKVEEIREVDTSDLVLQNTKDAVSAYNSSQFASKPSINEEYVGFADVMVELRGKLTNGSSKLDVISIVGLPGLGKTTLANKLYFDESVVSRFDIQTRCCISQEYTRKDLLLALLCDITDETRLDREAENELADKLRKLLLRKRYLVLIDDVWETSAWEELQPCFPEDNNGSRIILTTRHKEVASYAKHDTEPHELRFLNTDESWTLLNNKVFNKERCPPDLKEVGKEIVKRCGGLPLSIVLVAGILTRMKKEKRHWEQVVNYLCQIIQVQSGRTLDLSYHHLPPYLKPCFLYLGVFPEDREIQVSKLTWLWVAEGFIRSQTKKLLEDTAENYLENLIGRNLVMVAKRSSDGRIKACRIHDLVLEFCRNKAKSENFFERIKGDRGTNPFNPFSPKCKTPERLSLYSQCDYLENWCWSFSHLKSFQFREAENFAFSVDCASYTFRRFKFLRVLDIEFTIIDSFPQELTLLRYLAFRTTKDTISLPANLPNLETLIVQGLRGRVSLPDTIWNMVNLRHLHIYDQASFACDREQEYLESLSKMDDLQTLSSACFSSVDNADKILAKTPNLQKLRCIVSKFDGSFPAFSNLTMLKMLKISSGTKLTLINQLKFPSSLRKLTLSNFHIHLTEVASHPKLEVLKLLGVTISSNVWEVNDEQFPQLKYLKLENPSFSEWDASDNAFPRLEYLVLKRCRHLKAIASCFEDTPSLKSVEIMSCNESLAKSVMDVREVSIENSGTSGFEVFIHK